MMRTVWHFLTVACGCITTIATLGAELKSDETVIFFPTYGQRVTNGWELDIHGWVFEAKPRRALTAIFRRAVGIDVAELTSTEKAILSERAQYFLADNERRKKIRLKLGENTFTLDASIVNGHFTTQLRLTDSELGRLGAAFNTTNGRISFQTVSANQRVPSVSGAVTLLPESGLSILSDIDDTIKITQVGDWKAMMKNTFCQLFKPVPGMAAVYQHWSKSGAAQFHYVTASPWQLYAPLSRFTRDQGFPDGAFHMKSFRIKDETFFDLFRSPEKYKLSVVEPILNRFPKRRFILVGDSGEKDPEIYGSLARAHPKQIVGVFIRDVTSEPPDGARYQKAFDRVPKAIWKVFKDPVEIKDTFLQRGATTNTN